MKICYDVPVYCLNQTSSYPQANKTLSAQTDEWTAMIDKQMVEEMEIYEKHSETVSTLRLYVIRRVLNYTWQIYI